MARKEDKIPKGRFASKITLLLDHYTTGKQDVDIRRTRHNGWNQVIDAYMSVIPSNWPYTARVTDPRIRTTIVEKTGRLINSKLQGRLVPRDGSSDIIGARINNTVLDYQWDNANFGGSMLEKIALADQTTRLYGAIFALTFWDAKKNSNDIKVINPNDIFIDPAATHIRNAKWVVIREFTTVESLKKRGFDLKGVNLQQTPSAQRSNEYEDKVKLNKNLEDRVGQDLSNPTIIVATEYTEKKVIVYLPNQAHILKEKDNPRKDGRIPVSQLRYYPLGDDIYGEIEVEPVLPLARGINSFLSGFIDEMNNAMRPPLKIKSAGVRKETIEFGPGAQWIMDDLNNVEQMQLGTNAINSFNTVYPALIAAFNTAMGDQSLGVSNLAGRGEDKTATEVRGLEAQQLSRDQYNQQFLSEFLKDIMMLWLGNNQQFLFDDPSQEEFVMKIVGKDAIRDFQTLGLADIEVDNEDINEVADVIEENPEGVSDESIEEVVQGITAPKFPTADGRPKLDVSENGEEAKLTIINDDIQGLFDYIPDVKSMAIGAGQQQQQGRQKAFEMLLNPVVSQNLQAEGQKLNTKDLIVMILEDNGVKDAERLFEAVQTPEVPQPGQEVPGAPPQQAPAIPQQVV